MIPGRPFHLALVACVALSGASITATLLGSFALGMVVLAAAWIIALVAAASRMGDP